MHGNSLVWCDKKQKKELAKLDLALIREKSKGCTELHV
jgi:hypothetical protein